MSGGMKALIAMTVLLTVGGTVWLGSLELLKDGQIVGLLSLVVNGVLLLAQNIIKGDEDAKK
jgi:hypothetical protein